MCPAHLHVYTTYGYWGCCHQESAQSVRHYVKAQGRGYCQESPFSNGLWVYTKLSCYCVDPKTIRKRCEKKEQLVALKTSGKKSKRQQLVRAGRKALVSDLEEALFSWIMELKSRNLRASRCMIHVQARTMSFVSTFKVSHGWLERFIKRYFFSLRRKTTVCKKAPADCIPKLVNFITHLRRMQTQHKYTPQNMFAMDKQCAGRTCLLTLQLLLLVVVLFPSKQLDMKMIISPSSSSLKLMGQR